MELDPIGFDCGLHGISCGDPADFDLWWHDLSQALRKFERSVDCRAILETGMTHHDRRRIGKGCGEAFDRCRVIIQISLGQITGRSSERSQRADWQSILPLSRQEFFLPTLLQD